jgi:multiple sugar transport system permease protein
MIRSRRNEILVAYALMAPFIVIYAVLFIYPTIRTAQLSVTNAPLIGGGAWVGFENFRRLASDRLFSVATWNTIYFVVLSVIPITLLALVVALGVNRLKGWTQSIVLAAFFLPYILPVSVVTQVWQWILNKDFGVAQYVLAPLNGGQRVSVFGTVASFMPAVAFITIWWLIGFSVLLYIAGLRNISSEIYEAAEIDGAGRWAQFSRITWPLIWPITVLVFTIQLILELKIFDQVYLLTESRPDANMVMVWYIYKQAWQLNHGGRGAAASLVLFLVIVVLSVLQYQLLRTRGQSGSK